MNFPKVSFGHVTVARIILFQKKPPVSEFTDSVLFALERKENVVHIRLADSDTFYVNIDSENPELIRKSGADLSALVSAKKIKKVSLVSSLDEELNIAFLEGMLLATYEFDRYKSEASRKSIPDEIHLDKSYCSQSVLQELLHVCESVKIARDWVNEPVNFLTAEKLAEEFTKLSASAGFSIEVFDKTKIENMKMGGILAVNLGSPNPPTFSIMEYKPANAVNSKPIVLVGKGVVYDTGGLSLKPTEGSMDFMKCDMAGGAVVGAVLGAVALNKLPLHIIGLVPATENRPSGNAFTPGDIITMFDGTTVEVLNTDAEGRLILADALAFARQYNPALVIDLATLTGSAARAIGKNAAVMMGTADEATKEKLKTSGFKTFERLVEFPLWDDYKESIKSDIADLNNIGGPEAGAITAGKFLEHFTSYPWLHLDIAAPAFLKAQEAYRTKGGTGYGVRLLYNFLKNYR